MSERKTENAKKQNNFGRYPKKEKEKRKVEQVGKIDTKSRKSEKVSRLWSIKQDFKKIELRKPHFTISGIKAWHIRRKKTDFYCTYFPFS